MYIYIYIYIYIYFFLFCCHTERLAKLPLRGTHMQRDCHSVAHICSRVVTPWHTYAAGLPLRGTHMRDKTGCHSVAHNSARTSHSVSKKRSAAKQIEVI